MRVLSISTLFPTPIRAGFGIFVGNQMRSVVAQGGVELTMISPQGIAPWPLSLKTPYNALRSIPKVSDAAGLRVHYPRFTLIPKVGGDSNPTRIARSILPRIRQLHAETPFDLVDAQFFFPDGPAAAIIAHELALPLTIKARGADIHYWGSRPKARAQILAAAQKAAGMLAVSQALRDDMIALGMPAERIFVHYTGLDHSRFFPRDRQEARTAISRMPNFAIPEQGHLLLTPGALIPRKGQRMAIEALTLLPEARLALAGAGADESALRAYAHDLGLTERVHFLGQVSHDDLPTLMSAADVMVLPSASEGLANVWVEAIASGTPIVVPDIGGAAEILQNRSAGRLAARDGSAIAAAVKDLLNDEIDQQKVAENAAQFSWDQNARTLVQFWQGVADQRPALLP